MTLKKRLFYTTLFLLAFNTLEHTCHKLTGGFTLSRIQFTSPGISTNTLDPTTLAILDQPFHYLDCGHQCFAFISSDGHYILKFFKYTNHTPPTWTAQIPLLNRIKSLRPERINKITWKKERDFQGYQLAFDQFRKEAGLLSLHLNPTSSGYPTITLYDKLKIRHTLDLNNTPFVLQKKATRTFSQFSAWLQSGDLEKVRTGISQLITLCSERISRQIIDEDVHLYCNFGFVEGNPIQIDPGRFSLSASPLPPTALAPFITELEAWFLKHYPPLLPYVQECAKTH